MTFHGLHDGPLPLLLPNAWDVASALAFVDAGFPAVGTTSFGVAAAEGHPDGGRASREGTSRLVQALGGLGVYVSADVEDGYDDDPAEVAAFVASLGVDGVNVEDSAGGRLVEPAVLAAKVAAVKERSAGVFVNARVDTYWLGQDATVEATLERAHAYAEAGADGIFVPGAADPEQLRSITAALQVPVNVLAVPGRSLADLGRLGVRRVSTGSLPYRAAVDAAVEVARAVRDGRDVPPATSYAVMQARLEEHAHRRARPLS